MATRTKTQSKPTVSAVTRIQTLSKSRFASAVKQSENPSEVLRRLGIYANGRNVEAVRERAYDENVSFSK
jgi:predicted nucleotidyltransferase